MTSAFHQPGLSRTWSWKPVAAIGAVLVLAVAGLAYAAIANEVGAGSAAAGTAAQRGAPTLALGVVSGAATVPVDVPLRLSEASGLGSASILLTYDPAVVSLNAVREGDLPQSSLGWHHDETAGTLLMLLTTSLAEGATGDHVFAVVTLEAQDGAVGEMSPLSLSVREAATATGQPLDLTVASGTFRNGVPGDVTGDGKVDQVDYDRLVDYLVGKPVQIVALNADVNGDGQVTTADAVRIHQFLDATRASP